MNGKLLLKRERALDHAQYHWDTNDEETFPYGTAKPYEKIENAPFNIEDVFFKEDKFRLGFGYRLNNDSNIANKLLEYLLKKSDEFTEDDFLNKFYNPESR